MKIDFRAGLKEAMEKKVLTNAVLEGAFFTTALIVAPTFFSTKNACDSNNPLDCYVIFLVIIVSLYIVGQIVLYHFQGKTYWLSKASFVFFPLLLPFLIIMIRYINKIIL